MQDIARNPLYFLQDLASRDEDFLQEVQCRKDLLQDVVRSRKDFMHSNLAIEVQDSCKEILLDVQETGKITCKTARFLHILQESLQNVANSYSKIKCKILQVFCLGSTVELHSKGASPNILPVSKVGAIPTPICSYDKSSSCSIGKLISS